MTKHELCETLTSMGYEVQHEEGVPFLLLSEKEYKYSKISKVIKNLGYEGSWGMKIKQGGQI